MLDNGIITMRENHPTDEHFTQSGKLMGFVQMIKNSESEVFVAEIDGEIVASGSTKIKDDLVYLKHEKQGYLGLMFVPKQHRGKGLNKLILQALLNWCKERNVFEIKRLLQTIFAPRI